MSVCVCLSLSHTQTQTCTGTDSTYEYSHTLTDGTLPFLSPLPPHPSLPLLPIQAQPPGTKNIYDIKIHPGRVTHGRPHIKAKIIRARNTLRGQKRPSSSTPIDTQPTMYPSCLDNGRPQAYEPMTVPCRVHQGGSSSYSSPYDLGW